MIVPRSIPRLDQNQDQDHDQDQARTTATKRPSKSQSETNEQQTPSRPLPYASRLPSPPHLVAVPVTLGPRHAGAKTHRGRGLVRLHTHRRNTVLPYKEAPYNRPTGRLYILYNILRSQCFLLLRVFYLKACSLAQCNVVRHKTVLLSLAVCHSKINIFQNMRICVS